MVEQVKTKMEPRVRFRGFTDEWEEVKLGDVATFSKGKGLSKDSFSDDGVPCLHYGELFTTYEDNINSVNTFTDIDGVSMVYSEGCEVLVPSSSTVADKAVTASAINIPDVMLGGDINIIKPDSTLNNSFLSLLINYGYRNKVWALVQTGTITHLYNKDLKHLKIKTPSLDEQHAVGDLFQTLDKAIDLSNTQVENLKQQKKALLQRLFPQKGETEPKFRLRGFADEWEEVKLGDVLTERNVQHEPNEEYPLVSFTVEHGVTPKTDRYNREFLVKTSDKKYKSTELNDIVYNPANLKFGAIALNTYGKAVFSPIYVTFTVNDDSDPYYMGLFVTRADFINYSLKYQEGTVYERMAVKSSDFLSLDVPVPSLEEQQAIGELFQTVDEQIRLAEDKVSQYKELKRALLQRLFV